MFLIFFHIFYTIDSFSNILHLTLSFFDDLFIILREIIEFNSQNGRRSIRSNNTPKIFSLSHPTCANTHNNYLSQPDKDPLFYSNILPIGDLYLCEAPFYIKKLLSILCVWTSKSKKPIQKRKRTCVKCFSVDNDIWSDHYQNRENYFASTNQSWIRIASFLLGLYYTFSHKSINWGIILEIIFAKSKINLI